ncbi:MAG: hypothetical protein K2Y15_07800 [Burkholderiaceae bacterium]|nr:hypothetical protein [Burkholderiaceae bacterium]
MTNKKWMYLALVAVIAISLCLVIFGTGELIKELAGVPLVLALTAALFQIIRDQSAHERSEVLMRYQNSFAMGATSHMANVAFDKHAKFCEEYIKESYAALQTIFREGPTPEALNHASNLVSIRAKYAVWLTTEIENQLQPFEAAFRQMGASAGYVAATVGERTATQRKEHIDRMYRLLAQLSSQKEWDGEELTDDLAIATQIQRLRSILGIDELSKLRQSLLMRAVKELN